MTRGALLLVGGLVALVACAAGAVGTAAAVAHRAGTIDVEIVEPGGDRISVCVPAIAIRLAAAAVPRSVVHDAARDLEPWVPSARAAVGVLRSAPDVVLVEIDNRREHVTIAKHGPHVVVRATGPDRRLLRISVPLAAVGTLLDALDPARG
jgi:hypothetical protein